MNMATPILRRIVILVAALAVVALTALVAALALVVLLALGLSQSPPATRMPLASTPHDIAVESDGSFTPGVLERRVGDTVTWTGLGPRDSIVPFAHPVAGDPCDPAKALAVDTSSFVGPPRLGVPGVFVRGPDARAGGPAIIPYPGKCDDDPSPAIAATRQYCDNQKGVPHHLPYEMWSYPELTGELVVLSWDEIETADQVFDFSVLGHELDAAADHGKFVMLAIHTGQGEFPRRWIFETGVTPVRLKGHNSEKYSATSCGRAWEVGSFADAAYVKQLDELIAALGTYVKSDGAWVQALSAVQLVGVQSGTEEFQVQGTCPDDFVNAVGNGHTKAGRDGILDSYSGDDCVCNSAAWAASGWTPEGLVAFVDDQVATWHTEFWPHLVVRFGLKQAGLVSVDGPGNFANDTLFLQDGKTRICPSCASSDDRRLTSSSKQIDRIIGSALSKYGDTFWVMHFGIDPLPLEFGGARNCTYGGTLDRTAMPPIVTFPIPLVGPVRSETNCPNKWANNTTLTPPRVHMTGFQTNNPQKGRINSPARLESALMNVERNTNAVELDVYAPIFWLNHELNGSNGDMDPLRETPPYAGIDPDMRYSKSMADHVAELTARRESSVFAPSGKAFPTTYSFTFAAPGTYSFYNARTCSEGVGRSGKIVIQ
jgi:plastocyanin